MTWLWIYASSKLGHNWSIQQTQQQKPSTKPKRKLSRRYVVLVIHDLNTALLKNISLTCYVGPLIGKCTETFKNRTVYLNYFVLMKVYSANANTKKGEPK